MHQHIRTMVADSISRVLSHLDALTLEDVNIRVAKKVLVELRKEMHVSVDDDDYKAIIRHPEVLIDVMNAAKVMLANRSMDLGFAVPTMIIALSDLVTAATKGKLDGNAFARIQSYKLPKKAAVVVQMQSTSRKRA